MALWGRAWRFFRKLKQSYHMIQQSHSGAFIQRKLIWKHTHTPMFTAALFTTEKTQKQPKLKRPSTEGWMKKMWHNMQWNIVCVHSVVPDALRRHGLQPVRLLCPWGFPGKSAGAGCHFLLQGIFPTQGWNPYLLQCGQILHCWATGEACNGILLSHKKNEIMPPIEKMDQRISY